MDINSIKKEIVKLARERGEIARGGYKKKLTTEQWARLDAINARLDELRALENPTLKPRGCEKCGTPMR